MSQPEPSGEVLPPVTNQKKGRLRAFWDSLVLFSGISTASNLSRTQKRPVQSRAAASFSSEIAQVNSPAHSVQNVPHRGLQATRLRRWAGRLVESTYVADPPAGSRLLPLP